MSTLRISAWRGDRLIRLVEILNTFAWGWPQTTWRPNVLDGVGRTAPALFRLSEEGREVPLGDILRLLTDEQLQVIDGSISVSKSDGDAWIVLRTINGDDWDVETDDEAVLEAIRSAFGGAFIPSPE
jgi:hypothetical protein